MTRPSVSNMLCSAKKDSLKCNRADETRLLDPEKKPMPSEFRKKRDQERKRKSREALLEAATRVFGRKGYHKTLVSDIVTEANVGQGTFYRHFANKREIFETLLDRFIEKLLAEFSDMSAHLPENVEQYRDASQRAIERMAAVIDANHEIAALFLREAQSIDRQFEEKIMGFSQRFAGLARYYLDHAIAHGFARRCRSEVVAQALFGIGVHMIERWLKGEFSDISREELIAEVVNFAFLGFGPREGDR